MNDYVEITIIILIVMKKSGLNWVSCLNAEKTGTIAEKVCLIAEKNKF